MRPVFCQRRKVLYTEFHGPKRSEVFRYTTHSQMWVESKEDFAVKLSLQRYLMKKSAEPLMLVVDMTSKFR